MRSKLPTKACIEAIKRGADPYAALSVMVWPDGPPPIVAKSRKRKLPSVVVMCEARVWLGRSWGFGPRCSRRARYRVAGRALCGQHRRKLLK